jgi:hypothetical protein
VEGFVSLSCDGIGYWEAEVHWEAWQAIDTVTRTGTFSPCLGMDVVVYVYNLITRESEAGGLRVWGESGLPRETMSVEEKKGKSSSQSHGWGVSPWWHFCFFFFSCKSFFVNQAGWMGELSRNSLWDGGWRKKPQEGLGSWACNLPSAVTQGSCTWRPFAVSRFLSSFEQEAPYSHFALEPKSCAWFWLKSNKEESREKGDVEANGSGVQRIWIVN